MKVGEITKKRILVLENAVDVTGGLKSILSSSIALSNHFEFIFLLPTNTQCAAYVRNRGFLVVEFPFKEINRTIFSWIIYLPSLLINTFKLKKLVRERKIDLLIANDFYNLLPSAFHFLGGKIPYVCFVRFLPNRFPRLLVSAWQNCHIRFASTLIAVSNSVKNQLIVNEKLEVIYDGLPENFNVMSLPIPKATLPSNTLLYLSNYIEGKGQDLALKSFAGLACKYPLWKLRFVGGDMGTIKNKVYKESLMKSAIEMKIQEQVEWGAFAEEVIQEYKAAAIVLNFSNSESFSLTCLEAMAAGRPVISTNSGGPSEIIVDRESGILVPVGDIPAMTSAMDYLMGDPDSCEKIGIAAFHHVRKKFSQENTIAKLQEAYLKALAIV
ncbi:MAG: glycosyltransferase family 4 protein [Cyclobacteriaceae bacterium]|nr:glycosyltransferase family 4 protein [Cyclobacteriaceae bacterium]